MKRKLWLPVMAFVFAIGLSFATENATIDAAQLYIDIGNPEGMLIEVEGCGVGDIQCEVQFEGDSQTYKVYHDEQLEDPVMGSSTDPIVLPPLN